MWIRWIRIRIRIRNTVNLTCMNWNNRFKLQLKSLYLWDKF
jgi:hypothetical protein